MVQAGKTLAVTVRAVSPDGSPLAGPAVAVFFGPRLDGSARDPEHDVRDRQGDREVVLSFDPVSRLHRAVVSTAGWRPGAWTVCGRVLGSGAGVPDGSAAGWAYARFSVEP